MLKVDRGYPGWMVRRWPLGTEPSPQCAKDRKMRKSAFVHDRVSRGHFFLVLRSYVRPYCGLADYHLDRGGMPLHNTVGVNCEKAATTEIIIILIRLSMQLLKIEAQVPSIWA